VPGNDLRLVGEDGRDVGVGEVGELYVRNAMLMVGYHDNRDATRAASLPGGFITVGDLATCDKDGFYYLAGRRHDMVISGGVNIYPWEIEQRLHEHGAVADVAVIGVPDDEWGESLVAFVVCATGARVTSEDLIAHVRAELADHKRPRRVVFVDSLPRTPTGKVLKRELKERLLAGEFA
jgi:acyl-CoA synthetase (AMP-forming)/AMP-acid ligase II